MDIQCNSCGLIRNLTKKSIRRNKHKNNGKFICHQCKISDHNYKSKISKILVARNTSKKHIDSMSKKTKEHWDGEYGSNKRKEMKSAEYREKMSKSVKQAWKNENYSKLKAEQSSELWKIYAFRNLVSKKCSEKWEDDEYRQKVIGNMDRDKISENSKKMWADPEFKKRMTNIIKSRWADQKFKERMLKVFNSDEYRTSQAMARQGQLFSMTRPHKIVCQILDDIEVQYRIEEPIGPYNVDIFIPDYNIIIEIQGDYWHSMPEVIVRDRQKNTYITKFFPQYSIKYMWEHQLMSSKFAVSTIKQWLGLSEIELVDFSFKDVTISEVSNRDAHLFLSKHHYWLSMGKRATSYGAFLNDNLIAVCCMSPLTRKESAMRLGYTSKDMAELSRFCIHPQYHKKNFATWMIARCIKMIKRANNNLKCLISFADTTFGHDGTIYKASNWEFDGIVKPSYWYVDEDGYVMHKKTLWDHAKSLKMTEKEFAKDKGYRKVNGKKKLRFIYRLDKSESLAS